MTTPAPTAPVISTITFDQVSYTPGQTMHATVDYSPGTSPVTHSFTGNAVDGATGLTGDLVVNFITVINDSTVVSAADSGSRTWTKVSDSGTVAVFSATA